MENIKRILKSLFPIGSTGRWILSGLYSSQVSFLFSLFRSLKATKKITGKYFPIKVRIGRGQKLNIVCSSNCNANLSGNFTVNQWGGSCLPSSISCGEGATLTILGDFEIGPNVHISIAKDATLILKGRRNSTASGITCNTRIMVEKSVEIGYDCIIAWDVFITDSDWHDIKGSERIRPVFIGDNVWIGHGASVLKGAVIPSGCIVGAKSLVSKGSFPENSLICGIPVAIRRTEVEWSR